MMEQQGPGHAAVTRPRPNRAPARAKCGRVGCVDSTPADLDRLDEPEGHVQAEGRLDREQVVADNATRVLGITVGVICMAFSGGCGGQARWYPIESAVVAPDGRTITATILTNRPDPDGTSCQVVTNQQLSETRGQVVIGIETRDECEPLFPWEEGITTFAVGYRRELRFDLKSPLNGRQIMDRATQKAVPML
ncbi:hypothetical protein ACFWY5_41780 [Nonomuraea sp. NPDC059007]|uniref:hypothetical protein n=1 Tax=Nonomuraea sp. NPDC059007 TaxID=3346692 RepID=UPI00368F6A07